MASNQCEMNCGRDIVYPRHGLCGACYSSIRVWMKDKTKTELADRIVRLSLYSRRMETVSSGAVVIASPTIRKRYRR